MCNAVHYNTAQSTRLLALGLLHNIIVIRILALRGASLMAHLCVLLRIFSYLDKCIHMCLQLVSAIQL